MFRALLTISLLSVAAAAPAQPVAEQLQRYVQQQAAGSAPGARIEVTLGALDPRLKLAPCNRIEPFMPAGARLWGRSHVGMRCVDGASWAVNWPVTVRVFGAAPVAARPLAAQVPLGADDFTVAEVEWTREPQGVATELAQLDGRVLARPLAPGQPVPLASLRAPQVISQGDPVKLVGQGKGFAVAADAVALANAQDGQNVRVKTESGRVVTGIARAGRRVEVSF